EKAVRYHGTVEECFRDGKYKVPFDGRMNCSVKNKMRTQFIVVLSLIAATLAAPVTTTTTTTSSSSYYGDWSNWQTWQPVWLSTIAPQIKCSSNSPSSAVSPLSCTNCTTESTALIALFASKWQPYIDLIRSNVETQLD